MSLNWSKLKADKKVRPYETTQPCRTQQYVRMACDSSRRQTHWSIGMPRRQYSCCPPSPHRLIGCSVWAASGCSLPEFFDLNQFKLPASVNGRRCSTPSRRAWECRKPGAGPLGHAAHSDAWESSACMCACAVLSERVTINLDYYTANYVLMLLMGGVYAW